MTQTLEGKTAIITGGGSGIGRATCAVFAEAGATVIAADIDHDNAKQTAQSIGASASAALLDVADENQWQKLIDQSVDRYGKLDVLVNCAGIGRNGDLVDLALEDWNAMIGVNLTGVFLGCKHAVRAMRKTNTKGSIINISSIGGLVGGEDIAGYCATKGGVTMLTKSVALGAANDGIRCNSVHPTYVDSEMLDPVADQFPDRETMLAGMASLVPIGRVAKPQDIAATILFLASDAAAMMTGSQLVVDGGQLAGLPSRHSG